MTFDIVVGNPPYNKDIFLDFADIGAKLSKKIVCMITPAKWQTDADDAIVKSNISYKEWREKYVKHISDVVFYPYCTDVFNIWQTDGIAYYIIDKSNIFNKSNITNRCSVQKYLNNGPVLRCICNRESLMNIGDEIVKLLGDYKKYSIDSNNKQGRYIVWTNQQVAGGGLFSMGEQGSILGLGASKIIDTLNEEEMKDRTTSARCSFSSDNIDECKYFYSWLYTKFVNFFIIINISKLTGAINDDYFRFVPDPGKFDHIYTDEELYRQFGLIDEAGNKLKNNEGMAYIDIIESVVRRRKDSSEI